MQYLIQFAAGAGALLADALSQSMQNVRQVHQDESALVFESSTRIDVANKLPFANNVFAVLASTPRKGLESSIDRLVSQVAHLEFPRVQGRNRGFRVMAQIDGQLTPIDRRVRTHLEGEIATFTKSQVQAKGSCLEYWIVGRKRFDKLLLCLRLPSGKRTQPEKGELARELATLLVAASRPKPSDAFLDPFAGRGGLVKARLALPFASIICSDTKVRSLSDSLPRAVKSDRRVRLLSEDALTLPSIRDGEIDVIVTDPPWGEFARMPMSYRTFAEGMARSFDRVLDPQGGRFVVLGSRRHRESLTGALTSCEFRIHATHGILVNGHPASVIVGSR